MNHVHMLSCLGGELLDWFHHFGASAANLSKNKTHYCGQVTNACCVLLTSMVLHVVLHIDCACLVWWEVWQASDLGE